ncbi:MAG: NAD(P)H-dependent glycerol-3-phosphate dehydrogenase [Acidiferrobacterales bacterium]
MSDPAKKVAVLGAGSWGTALAILLARNGFEINLWGHDPAHMARLAHERENANYLPGISFPDNLSIQENLIELAHEVRCFLVVVPSHAFRATLQAIQPAIKSDTCIAWATKGLETGTHKLLSQVLGEVLGDTVRGAVVSGPTFAREVADNLPTGLTVASASEAVAEDVAGWFRNDRVRVYTNSDVVGVQLGGAIKNVIAIAAGISDGLGFGANARVALITRGLAELTRLGVAMGGHPETFMGLAGVGDLILTCTDDQSRNRRVGIGLGRGRKLPEILGGLGQEAEGVTSARELLALAAELGVDLPITEQTARVLAGECTPVEAVEALLSREPRTE